MTEFRPGDIRVCDIRNLREDPNAGGKPRPAVLVYETRDGWHVMGLTTKDTFANGESRIPVPNPQSCGLGRSGFLWGTLTALPLEAIGERIGVADLPLTQAIVRSRVNLSDDDVVTLLMAVSR